MELPLGVGHQSGEVTKAFELSNEDRSASERDRSDITFENELCWFGRSILSQRLERRTVAVHEGAGSFRLEFRSERVECALGGSEFQERRGMTSVSNVSVG